MEKGIKDSGHKREFSTGSHRDASSGKGRCDLLPESSVLEVLAMYDRSTAMVNTVQMHLCEAVKDIMRYKQDTAESDYVVLAAVEALIAVGLDEGDEDIPVTCADDDLAHLAYGLMKTSLHYEEGAQKYGENNWKLGQPLHVLIDSGLRHCFKGIAGVEDEPHIRAAAWNFLCALWMIRNMPEMQDLPVSGDVPPERA